MHALRTKLGFVFRVEDGDNHHHDGSPTQIDSACWSARPKISLTIARHSESRLKRRKTRCISCSWFRTKFWRLVTFFLCSVDRVFSTYNFLHQSITKLPVDLARNKRKRTMTRNAVLIRTEGTPWVFNTTHLSIRLPQCSLFCGE